MRYKEGHKEETRRRIIEAASKRFRKDGSESVGVADLMSEAGLTHGGFYAHFKNKEDLFREAIGAAAAGTSSQFEQLAKSAANPIDTIVKCYLSRTHRDDPRHGCVVACLGSEVPRRPRRTRRVYAESFDKIVSLLETYLPGAPTARRKLATAMFAMMMGALQLARAEPDVERSNEILESATGAALALVKNMNVQAVAQPRQAEAVR